MSTDLDQMLAERPVRRDVVDAHKARMLAEVRAYHLRELREMYGMTQVQLASELHVSQNRVSKIERGQIENTHVDTLRRYVEAMGGTLHVEVKVGDETFQLA